MGKWNGSEEHPNVTNQTLFAPSSCTGSWPSKMVEITTYSILMTFSLIGNLLVVAVFYRNKTLRTPVHYFIVNMAIADLIFPVIALPDWMSQVYHDGLWLVDGVLGTVLCKLVWSAWGVSTAVSILSMVAIAADRFHAVLFPMKLTLFSRNKRRLIIAVIWVASVAFRAHWIYAAKLDSYDTGLRCEFQWQPASHKLEVLKITWIVFFCLTSLSAIALTVLYSSIMIFLFRQKSNIDLATEIVKKREKKYRQITYMLITIVVVFYAVWIPCHLENLFFYLKPSIKLPCLLMWLVNWVLPPLYTVVNPVVYYIFNENYRQGFRELLCCPWPCHNKYNDRFQPSTVSPQGENNTGQMNNAFEDIELKEQ